MKKLMIGLISVGILFVSGCENNNEAYQEQINAKEIQIAELEDKIESKNETIAELEETIENKSEISADLEEIEEVATEEPETCEDGYWILPEEVLEAKEMAGVPGVRLGTYEELRWLVENPEFTSDGGRGVRTRYVIDILGTEGEVIEEHMDYEHNIFEQTRKFRGDNGGYIIIEFWNDWVGELWQIGLE